NRYYSGPALCGALMCCLHYDSSRLISALYRPLSPSPIYLHSPTQVWMDPPCLTHSLTHSLTHNSLNHSPALFLTIHFLSLCLSLSLFLSLCLSLSLSLSDTRYHFVWRYVR